MSKVYDSVEWDFWKQCSKNLVLMEGGVIDQSNALCSFIFVLGVYQWAPY